MKVNPETKKSLIFVRYRGERLFDTYHAMWNFCRTFFRTDSSFGFTAFDRSIDSITLDQSVDAQTGQEIRTAHNNSCIHFATQTLFMLVLWRKARVWPGKYDSDAWIINVWGCADIFPQTVTGEKWSKKLQNNCISMLFPEFDEIRIARRFVVTELEQATRPSMLCRPCPTTRGIGY